MGMNVNLIEPHEGQRPLLMPGYREDKGKYIGILLPEPVLQR